MKNLLWVLALSTFPAFATRPSVPSAVTELKLPTKGFDGTRMPLRTHALGRPLADSLALNLPYDAIRALREPISARIGRPIDFFKGWEPDGEAHVTVITPPEFGILSKGTRNKLRIADLQRIALRERIQQADLEVLGLGSGQAVVDGKEEETFFVLVESATLRRIRLRVWEEFVAKGGNPREFDPAKFYPHVTIGYTRRDLHENDGVLKGIGGSWDPRFKLVD